LTLTFCAGHRELNRRLIKLIGHTFGVNENWLLTGKETMFVTYKNVELMEIIDLFNKLHSDLRPLVIEQLKILLKLSNKSLES
jgi:hypothetical protein